ncbi:MAG TPA: RpiB/LacA/LacB family sugar-phosphate isomerase [Candidatus Saccharimonadales bacterium]|nr:RpiB/LacA/LacB family sugar-phosphate isomerase [Candidatus Saccharimonadales bacterium]
MNIALACDHAGFEPHKELITYLESLGYDMQDYGPQNLDPDDDYPDFILPAARAVSEGKCQYGIILGGDGEGEAMVANKIKGIRCALVYGPAVAKRVVDAKGRVSHNHYEIAKLTRLHNNANMLSLAARFMSLEEMKHVIKLWLQTPFGREQRHIRRIEKIDELGS